MFLSGGFEGRHAHHQQAGDHGDVAGAVGEEAPALADDGYQQAGNGRTDNARRVEHGRVQRDGVHEVGLADHLHDEGLARGDVEGVDHAEQRGKHEDVPDLDGVGEGQSREDEGQQHGGGLGGDDHAPAAVTIGDDAGDGGEQKERNLPGESDAAQQHQRPGDAVDQPGLREVLHPGAAQRNELAREKELEVAVLQGAQGGGEFQHYFHFSEKTGQEAYWEAGEGNRVLNAELWRRLVEDVFRSMKSPLDTGWQPRTREPGFPF